MDGYGKRVLIVDDDHHARFLLGSLLDYAGYHVVPACDGLAALNELRRRHFDVVITDYHMPLLNGMAFLRQVQRHYPWLPVILLSGILPDELSQSDCPPFACIRKPYDKALLLELVCSAVRRPVATLAHQDYSTAV